MVAKRVKGESKARELWGLSEDELRLWPGAKLYQALNDAGYMWHEGGWVYAADI